MPKFLEQKLRAEYGDNPRAIYGTLNVIGAMRGNKETAKGRAMDAKHARDMAAKSSGRAKAAPMPHPHRNLGTYLQSRKSGKSR